MALLYGGEGGVRTGIQIAPTNPSNSGVGGQDDVTFLTATIGAMRKCVGYCLGSELFVIITTVYHKSFVTTVSTPDTLQTLPDVNETTAGLLGREVCDSPTGGLVVRATITIVCRPNVVPILSRFIRRLVVSAVWLT